MSYTQVDWINDLIAAPNVNLNESGELVTWLREDQRCIVYAEEMDAVLAHLRSDEHDHDLCELAEIHWEKERIDWL